MWKAWTPSRHVPCTCAVPNLRQIVRGTGQSKWSHHFKDGRSHSSSSASQGNEAVYQKSGDRDHARPRRALSGKVHTPAVSSDEAAVKYLLRRSWVFLRAERSGWPTQDRAQGSGLQQEPRFWHALAWAASDTTCAAEAALFLRFCPHVMAFAA